MPSKAVAPRRRPTQERAKATREHILGTTARLFGERGIADTSTNRIAAAAGVSIGTVYRYFSDRAVMVEELLRRPVLRASALEVDSTERRDAIAVTAQMIEAWVEAERARNAA